MEGATERSPGLIVVSLPGLIGIAQALNLPLVPEVLARIPDAFQTATKAGPFHVILIGRKGSSLLDPLRAVASTRLVMNIQQGRIFVHGAAPWTPKFVLAEGATGRPYRLLRVV